MDYKGKKRLLLSSLYLGALFMVAGWAFYYLQHFSGSVFLLPGASESLAFSPAGEAFRPSAAQRAVAPDLLLFDNPASVKALRSDQLYDGLILPFSLRLEKVEILREYAPWDVLRIEEPRKTSRQSIKAGEQIDLGGESLEILEVGPWAGLVRDPRGEPMAVVEVPDDSASERRLVFLESGAPSIVRPDLSLCFQWHGSEAEARQAFVPSLDAIPGARWGVREDNAIQWFENLVPGSGLVLRDGTQITIGRAERGEGRITLEIQRSIGRELRTVRANAAGPEDKFIYEDPAATGRMLYLHAWRENRAVGRLLQQGAPVQEFEMAADASSGAPVLLKQVMAQALAVPGDTVRAARVRLGEQTAVLREGSAETLGDFRLLYQIEPVPPDARYRITALDPQGGVMEEHSLEGDQQVRIGPWVLALSRENPFAPHGVALTAERRPGGWTQTIGLALFVLGSFGLVVARFAPRA